MNFHSVGFFVFLAVVLPIAWLALPSRSWRLTFLLLASLVFYGSYELWYLTLILGSTLLDYFCGRKIHEAGQAGDARGKRRFLLLSLGGNLGALGFFKYTDWLVESVQLLLDSAGSRTDLWELRATILPEALLDGPTGRILVPVGISFYTFQTLSYTIDIYRGVLAPAKSLRDFALFVAFFPQLVAGPIVRAIDFLPQLDRRPPLNRERFHDGLWRLSTGLLKKVAIADILGGYLVDPVYAAPGDFSTAVHLLALYGFTFQIYFDFSGYSDIAIGVAKLIGFDLPENFLTPYRSRSVREFWRRWHISLSSWVRDYLFFPLGGSRGTELVVARNLLITMLVIGIWHGASILWVIYGLLQGGVMILERALERRRGGELFAVSVGKSLFAWALTFHFIVFSCLFIRATSLGQIGEMLGASGPNGIGQIPTYAWWALAGGALTHFWPPAVTEWFRLAMHRVPTVVAGLVLGVAVGAVAVLVVGETPYIYFQF